jgi:hypothetical protein
LTHVLVEQHGDQERERIAAEQLIGGGVQRSRPPAENDIRCLMTP